MPNEKMLLFYNNQPCFGEPPPSIPSYSQLTSPLTLVHALPIYPLKSWVVQACLMHILGRLRQVGVQTLHNSIIEIESRLAVSHSLSQQQREVPAHCLSINQRNETSAF